MSSDPSRHTKKIRSIKAVKYEICKVGFFSDRLEHFHTFLYGLNSLSSNLQRKIIPVLSKENKDPIVIEDLCNSAKLHMPQF